MVSSVSHPDFPSVYFWVLYHIFVHTCRTRSRYAYCCHVCMVLADTRRASSRTRMQAGVLKSQKISKEREGPHVKPENDQFGMGKSRQMKALLSLSFWHERVYHAANGCQGKQSGLTAVGLRGQKKACQGESKKQQVFLLIKPRCRATSTRYAAQRACCCCACSNTVV